MPRFSANLGFLWPDLSLPEAIRAAHAAGFDAVECHWPFETAIEEVQAALADTGLKMLGLNTRRGDISAGDNGLAAQPGREPEARAAIDEAIAYAAQIDCAAVHVMAGFGRSAEHRAAFLDNLSYACARARPHNITILIEPLNRHDAPDYFLHTTDQAAAIIREVAADNLGLMFDCYHVGRSEGDVITRARALQNQIGHIQFAGVPARGVPDQGELNYAAIFAALDGMGWHRPLGAEYKPGAARTQDTLGWMKTLAG